MTSRLCEAINRVGAVEVRTPSLSDHPYAFQAVRRGYELAKSDRYGTWPWREIPTISYTDSEGTRREQALTHRDVVLTAARALNGTYKEVELDPLNRGKLIGSVSRCLYILENPKKYHSFSGPAFGNAIQWAIGGYALLDETSKRALERRFAAIEEQILPQSETIARFWNDFYRTMMSQRKLAEV